MPDVVAYLRVSSETQVEKGFGLDVQQESIELWAEAGGHTIRAWFTDEALSGKLEAAERPALAAALVAVDDGAEGLVTAKLDRLARQLTVQEAILARIWSAGGAVWTCELGEVLRDDPDDPMRTAMRQMAGVFAQLERGMIAARLRAGRRLKHGRGGYAGYGAPPFGQRAEAHELVVDDVEAATVRRMVELRSAGHSLRAIAEVLDTEGRPTKRGGVWHSHQVGRVLERAGAPLPQ